VCTHSEAAALVTAKEAAGMTVELEKLLDYITENVYDEGHGLLPGSAWVLNAASLLEYLAEQCHMTEEEMGKAFDEARIRVHGERRVEQ
jgi:hypothetical protein